MHKAGALEIPAEVHFDAHGAPGEDDHADGLQSDDRRVHPCENPHPLQGARFNKPIDGVPLKERKQNVDQRADHVKN